MVAVGAARLNLDADRCGRQHLVVPLEAEHNLMASRAEDMLDGEPPLDFRLARLVRLAVRSGL